MPKKIEKIVEFILENFINLQKFPNSFGKKMTSKKNLDLTHQWPPPPRNIDHMQELKMDDSGSQQCSILLWPAKADSAQLKR
jgi:hypothetical protein